MIPLFKSHYSIGKSILTLKTNKENAGSADSIINMAKDSNLKHLVLVEDSLTGFLEAKKNCGEEGIKLIFGLRVSICNKIEDKEDQSNHKIVIFPKNSKGCILLNQISTELQLKGEGRLDMNMVENLWSENDLKMCVPFYDSFIYNNAFSFSNCVPSFESIKPDFFIESNCLPVDGILKEKVDRYCKDHNLKTVDVKSVFYKDRKDFDAYVTYKCICNRKKFMSSLDKPGLDHLGSREFSYESWKENV